MADVDVSLNKHFTLRIKDAKASAAIEGRPGRSQGLGINPGKVTFNASGSVQIVESLESQLNRKGSGIAVMPNGYKLLGSPLIPFGPWDIGFYQVLHSLKREVFREKQTAGRMAAVQRVAPGPAGYAYEKIAVGVHQNHRDANPAMAPFDYPWYDDNSGLKRTHRELGDSSASSAIHLRPISYTVSMSDAPGVVPKATSRAEPRVIAVKQEASFTTFLVLFDKPARKWVVVLTSWTWTANFVYAEIGGRPPRTSGGILITSTDTTPRLSSGMPAGGLPDTPVAKQAIDRLRPFPAGVADIDAALR